MQGRKILAKLQAYKVQKTEEELKKKYGTEKIIKLNANENPYGTSAKVLQSMKEIKDISKYPDGYCMQLREALVALKGPMGNIPNFRKAVAEALKDEKTKQTTHNCQMKKKK